MKFAHHVQLFVTQWTIQSMEFSRPDYCSGSPFPSPGDLPNPGMEAKSPTLQVDPLLAEPRGKPQDFYEERIKKRFTCYSTRVTIFLLFHKWMATSISPPQVSTLQFQENFLQYLMEFFSMICRWLTPKSVFKTQILFK